MSEVEQLLLVRVETCCHPPDSLDVDGCWSDCGCDCPGACMQSPGALGPLPHLDAILESARTCLEWSAR